MRLLLVLILTLLSGGLLAATDYCAINTAARADSSAAYITPCGDTWVFMQYGHSIPLGNGCVGGAPPTDLDNDGYRRTLMDYLNANGWDIRWRGWRDVPTIPTCKCGQTDAVGGFKMYEIYSYLNFITTHLKSATNTAKTAVWLVGTSFNDFYYLGATYPQIQERYYAMLTKTASLNPDGVIVAGNEIRSTHGVDVSTLNTTMLTAYQAFTTAFPIQKTAWIDAYTSSLSVTNEQFCGDGWHPNQAGYAVLGNGILTQFVAQVTP